MEKKTILQEAHELIYGGREEDYGDPKARKSIRTGSGDISEILCVRSV